MGEEVGGGGYGREEIGEKEWRSRMGEDIMEDKNGGGEWVWR